MKGRYPIKIFYNNILQAIERDYSIRKGQHLEAIKNGLVNPGIVLVCNKSLKPPYADLKTRKIVFYESYYAFLWSVIYFLFTAYEKYYIAIANAKYKGESLSSVSVTEELRNAFHFFLWGLNLRDKYSDWPEEILKLDNTNSWHSKITHIWIRSIVFVFYHEYAHLILKHASPANIEMEKEADNFALDLFYSENVDEESIEIPNLLGATSALTANLFLIDSLKGIQQKNHPDLDIRIDNLYRKIRFNDSGREYYFKTFVAFAASIFFRIIGNLSVNFEREVNTAEGFWNKCLKYFDSIKKGKLI